MKNMFLAVALTAMGTISAHNSIDVDQCSFDMPYDIDLSDGAVVITDDDKTVMTIDRYNQLYIEGKKQDLNEDQQQTVVELADGFRDLVPAVAKIAGEATELGLKAAAMTLNVLFVDDQELTDQFMVKFEELGKKVEQHANKTHLSSSKGGFEMLDEPFDEEFDALVEEAVEKASGKVALRMLRQIFSNDPEEQADMEFRWEMFEQDIELELEQQAEDIEKAANQLCGQLKTIDDVEQRLQQSLPAYRNIDVVEMDESDKQDAI